MVDLALPISFPSAASRGRQKHKGPRSSSRFYLSFQRCKDAPLGLTCNQNRSRLAGVIPESGPATPHKPPSVIRTPFTEVRAQLPVLRGRNKGTYRCSHKAANEEAEV